MEVKVVNSSERLDKYLSQNTDYSRTLIQKMIDEDYVFVNGKKEKANYRLKDGDLIQIKDGYVKPLNVEPEDILLDIVYENDNLMIINKPSGMVVHPGNGNNSHTMVNALLGYSSSLSDENGDLRPGIVHRIDKDTSGLMVVAKNNKSHELLAEAFKNKTITRKYLALVIGEIKTDTGLIDAPIGRDKNERKRMCVTDVNSKRAVTFFKVLKRYKGYTLVELKLETGRTHQIRVHMKYIGFPVFNDPVYTNPSASSFGQFLHSYLIDFEEPITKEHLHFEATLPKEFSEFLKELTPLEK